MLLKFTTVAGLAFSPDADRRFMYSADQGNSHIHVIDRATLEVLDTFGDNGNHYTAEAQRGRRVQRSTFTGMASTQ